MGTDKYESLERLLTILELATREIDLEINKWISCPTDTLRKIVESDCLKAMLKDETLDIKTLDLLMIRVQCTEEFQRVAKEHCKLLVERDQMEI